MHIMIKRKSHRLKDHTRQKKATKKNSNNIGRKSTPWFHIIINHVGFILIELWASTPTIFVGESSRYSSRCSS